MSKTINNNNAYRMAQDIKNHVEAGKTGLPGSLSYEGVTYNWHEMMYIMPYMVKNPFANTCEIGTLTRPSDAWKGDNINEQVSKSDFTKQAENIVNYISKNKTIPNYVTTIKSKLKVNANHYTYCMAKIFVWFVNHSKVMPLQCLYRSSDVKRAETITKHGRSTQTGCNNRGQNNGVYCAPHMAQEIIRNLTGIVIPQATIASVMGTGSAGTGHGGIDTFFAWFNKKYGYKLSWTWKNFSDVGWEGIKNILNSNNQDCGLHELYRDTWGHYTNFDKVYENSVDVHNSLGSTCASGCYCGYTENRSKSEARRYLNGISQKSVIIVTNGGKA